MSFRTEANKVRAGIARGDYKKKRDYFGSFVDPLVSGMQAQAAAKMQEDLEKRREDRAAARELKKAQDAKELQDKKNDALADAFMMSQGASSPVAKSQIVALINAGYDDPAKLTEFFKDKVGYDANPNMSPQGPNVPSDSLISDFGGIKVGDNSYTIGSDGPITVGQLGNLSKQTNLKDGVADTAGQMARIFAPLDTGDGGKFIFDKKEELFDISKLTDRNWSQTAQQLRDERKFSDARRVEAWASSQSWFEVIPGYSKTSLLEKKLEDIETIVATTPLTEDQEELVKGIVNFKTDQAAGNKFWSTLETSLDQDLEKLQSYIYIFKADSDEYKNIEAAIEVKETIAGLKSATEASQQLEKPSSYYDQALKALQIQNIAADDPLIDSKIKTIQTLTAMKSFALSVETDKELATTKAMSAKEQALDAWYEKNGYYIMTNVDGANVVNIPTVEALAQFEKQWAEATAKAKEPDDFYTEDKLLAMPIEDLKVLIDTGLLSDRPNVENLVKNMYDSRSNQKLTTQVFDGNFNSVGDINRFIAQKGTDLLGEDGEPTPEMDSLIRQKVALLDEEERKAAEQDINLYQLSLREFFKDKEMTIENMAEFDRSWKEMTTVKKEPKFVTRTLYAPNGDTIEVDSEDMQRQYIMQGFSAVKSGPVTQMLRDMNLEDNAENRAKIAQVKNGILSIGAKIDGTPIFINKIDGSATDVYMGNVSSPTVPTTIADLIPETGGLALKYVDEDNNPKVLPISQEEIAQAQAFEKTISASARAGMQGAVGIRGVWNKFFGKITDAAGFQGFKNETNAIAFIEGLRLNTTVKLAAAQGTRDSVWQKQQILFTLPETAKFWQGPIETGAKVQNTLKLIEQGIENLQKELASEKVSKADKSDATKALIAMQDLQVIWSDLNSIFEEINAGKIKNKPKVSSFLKPKTD